MSEDAIAGKYQHALEQLTEGVYDPDHIKLIREGVVEGYVRRIDAVVAVMKVFDAPEMMVLADALDDVAHGREHWRTVPYVMKYVRMGILDQEEVNLSIMEGLGKRLRRD